MLDLGLVGTEMVYFAVGDLGLDGGVCVTASHNPKQYTGMKIVREGALPVGGESGLLDVRDRALVLQEHKRTSQRQAQSYDIWDAFVAKVLSFVDVAAIGPLKVVIDAANGMAGAMLPPVLERLPIEAVPCYFEPDGSFPNHEPNPLLPENREFIVAKTLEERQTSGSPTTATPTAASSSTTPASSSPATSSRRCWPSRSSRRRPAATSSTTSGRAAPCRRRSSAPAARR